MRDLVGKVICLADSLQLFLDIFLYFGFALVEQLDPALITPALQNAPCKQLNLIKSILLRVEWVASEVGDELAEVLLSLNLLNLLNRHLRYIDQFQDL